MAIDDLPGPLVNFLNVIGIEWPYINEDSISQFASVVREFGQAVERTHQDATDAVQKLAQAHQGASTRQMASGWAELSTAHVTEIVAGAGIVADALDAWAAYIVVQKGIAVAQMVEMAVEFFADQAAAVAPADPIDNHGTAGWRDDQWGHDFGDGNKVGPHVNAWNDKLGIGNSHLYYACGG